MAASGGTRLRRCGQGGGWQRLPRRHRQLSQHIPRALRLLPRHLLGRPQAPVSTRRREAPRPLLYTSAILHLRLIPTAVEPPLALHRPVSNHPSGSFLLSAAAACCLPSAWGVGVLASPAPPTTTGAKTVYCRSRFESVERNTLRRPYPGLLL